MFDRWICPLGQLNRFAVCAMVVCSAIPAIAQSGGAADSLQFDVASVKKTTDLNQPGRITRPTGQSRYSGTNMPLVMYLAVAYQLRSTQISGPDWIFNTNFDVEAKAEKPSTVDELHTMLQHLLEERFHMKVRREAREQAAYALVVDKGAPKLTAHDPEDTGHGPIMPGAGMHNVTNATMAYFAFYLSQELDRTVVDKTGLTGGYDFKVEWAPDRSVVFINGDPAPGSAAPMQMQNAQVPAGPTLMNALRQQLGLRLDPIKTPVEHLVIDHIESLTEN